MTCGPEKWRSLVKRVRYAFAAVGIMPTLAILAPPATAAAYITHTPARPAKAVRLNRTATIAEHACHTPAASASYTSGPQLFYFQILRGGHCVDSQHASLHGVQKGLTERLSAYSKAGTLTHRARVGETIINDSITEFPNVNFSALNWNGVYEICAALVSNGTSNVRYGPLCLHF
jgi:hypothetical protein